jgi:outer membrane protein assembly factor BamB
MARFISATLLSFLSIVSGLLWVSANAHATDWPQFRGPNRDGVWNETGLLETFPKDGLKFCWKHELGGGFSSPVVANGRVLVSDVELVKPSAYERIHCFDEKNGKVQWVFRYPENYLEWTYVPERGAGPTATPIVEHDRVYVLGAYGHVHCLDVRTGSVIWEKHIGHEYEVAEMACRPSPLIEGSLLIVFTGARPGASVLALNKETGKEVWKALDDHVSDSTPIVITLAGKRQLIVWSDDSIASLDLANGHTNWREPITTSNNDSVATPLFQGNRLLVSGLMLELRAEPPGAKFLWPENRVPSKRLLSNTSTAVWQGEYIYSARTSGALVCLNAATGEEVWRTNSVTTQRNGAAINITPQGNGYFLFTDEGNLIRAQLSPAGYQEISRAHLIDPQWPFNGAKFVYAPPAFANRHVFARSETEIVCASLEADK